MSHNCHVLHFYALEEYLDRQEGSLDHHDSEAKCWFKLSESETLQFIYANSSTYNLEKKKFAGVLQSCVHSKTIGMMVLILFKVLVTSL